MIDLVFLGAPGAGKGTQAKDVCGKFAFKHVSTGDLLREEKEKNTPLASIIKGYMDKGELVPDDVVLEVLKRAVVNNKDKKGVIFDGFPRNVEQARQLDQMLAEVDNYINKVIFFDVDEDVSVQRLSGRLVCSKCGANFHVTNMPPKKKNVCDKCQSELYHRDDDNPEVIEKRWVSYFEHTKPLVDYYKEKDLLVHVNANVAREKTQEELVAVIGSLENDNTEHKKRV